MKDLVLQMIKEGASHRTIQKATGLGLATISRIRNQGGDNRVLVIGDLHLPCERDGYLDFCLAIQKKYKTNRTVFIGDVLEHSVISFHDKHPDAPGAKQEYAMMKERLDVWHGHFPNSKVCIGSHDERPSRLARSVNMPPDIYLKSYNEVWGTNTWEWDFQFKIDDVTYMHGTGYGGKYPYANASHNLGMSVVMGHLHATAGIYWNVSSEKRWFGMSVGCGVDDKTYAFEYAKHCRKKSVISCGVVDNGHPYLELMYLERY